MNEGFKVVFLAGDFCFCFLIKTTAPALPVLFTHIIISLQNAQLQQEVQMYIYPLACSFGWMEDSAASHPAVPARVLLFQSCLNMLSQLVWG